jgi:microcystin-dependent protein
MPAILAPISGQPRFRDGRVLYLAKAYFYEAGTTTPKRVFKEASLSTPHAHPVAVDGEGNFPPIYIGTGTYKMRVTDQEGAILSEYDGLQGALAEPVVPDIPEIPEFDPSALPTTGDLRWRYDTNAVDGWVRSNGRSIGSASSGASERANADCEALFLHLWDRDPSLSVSGGRGTTAAADWAANKAIDLPDARFRDLRGLDDMGNIAAGRAAGGYMAAGTATTLGAQVGRAAETLDGTQIPAHAHPVTEAYADANGVHSHAGTTNTTGSHNHGYQDSHIIAGPLMGEGGNYTFADQARNTSSAGNHSHTLSIADAGYHSHTLHVSVGNTGGGLPHNNLSPGLLATLYIKL